MTPAELETRTKKFAIDVLRFATGLPRGIATDVIARQLIKSGTGTASNYRQPCRAKSDSDFIMKTTNPEEEADESASHLTRIFGASINTARKGRRRRTNHQQNRTKNPNREPTHQK